jgi:ABC-type multidrug transport system fused ATPase/permease subunit
MQLIFPGWMAALPIAEVTASPVAERLMQFMHREEVRSVITVLLVLTVVSQFIRIASFWVASKGLVGGEEASFVNAGKLWLFSSIASFTIFFFVGYIVGIERAVSNGRINIATSATALVIGSFLVVAVVTVIVMGIYGTRPMRSFAMLLVAGAISTAIGATVTFLIAGAMGIHQRIAALEKIGGETEVERHAFYQRLFGKDADDEIDRMLDDATKPFGPPATLTEREETVRALQKKLEARRISMGAGDSAARAHFAGQFDRYKDFLATVKSERAALQSPAAH